MVQLRVSGDYLQTSAMVRDGHVISAVNDPNDYLGPGTGYRLTERAAQGARGHPRRPDREKVLRSGGRVAGTPRRGSSATGHGRGAPAAPTRTRSSSASAPAFGLKLFRTLAGHPLVGCCEALIDGHRREGGGVPRIVRMRTRPTPRSWG